MSSDVAEPIRVRATVSFWFQRHGNGGLTIDDVAFNSAESPVTTEELGRMLTILGASLRDRVRLKTR